MYSNTPLFTHIANNSNIDHTSPLTGQLHCGSDGAGNDQAEEANWYVLIVLDAATTRQRAKRIADNKPGCVCYDKTELKKRKI